MISKSRAGAIIVGIVACTSLAWIGWKLTLGKPETIDDAAARIIAEKFLTDIRGGQPDVAWKSASAEFQSLQGRETFRAFVKSKPEFKTAPEFLDCTMKDVNRLSLADLRYRATTNKTIALKLAWERGVWKVERLSIE